MITKTYRAYCTDVFCKWEADDSWEDEEIAWEDLRAHMDSRHWPLAGVRQEPEEPMPTLEEIRAQLGF